ncbi:hypothetical protein Leryth_022970 [Lithospermum erythrorhizon]|nr:hypothetical protein Leryth_022970 [Lithospermum erythrorhizon]
MFLKLNGLLHFVPVNHIVTHLLSIRWSVKFQECDGLMEGRNKSVELSQTCNLPPEIINEILLRLPVQSLLKFKCVSKSWLILISSSEFIKTHVSISRKPNNYSNYTVILASHAVPITYYTCSLSSILSNTVMDNSRALEFPMSDLDFQLWFVGSCNGLLCVSIDPTTLVLYNPSIRKLKPLPISGTDTGNSSYISYGFCFDELCDDFKVVELNIVLDRAFMYSTGVKVYSLRNDSWRKFENDHEGRICSSGGQSVGGILHWRISMIDGRYLIFAVNTVTNIYDTLAAPPTLDKQDVVAEWSLGELNGCLAVFRDYYNIRLDVWAMKEYGVKESWSKVVSIPYPVNPSGHLWPLFVLQNAEIFLDYGPYLMLYNSGNNSFTTCEIHSIGGLCSVAAPAYIESLVTPTFVQE